MILAIRDKEHSLEKPKKAHVTEQRLTRTSERHEGRGHPNENEDENEKYRKGPPRLNSVPTEFIPEMIVISVGMCR